MTKPVEQRSYPAKLTLEGRTLIGRAANYNVRSHDLGGFQEVLEPGCFARSLSGDLPSGIDDILCHYNHDRNTLLGRTGSKTLRLKEDSEGLAFEVDLPDTQLGRDIEVLIGRGDLNGCSFGMIITDKWTDLSNGIPTRHVKEVELLEISIVHRPAYPKTEVALRSLEEAKQEEARKEEYRAWLQKHEKEIVIS